jgi:hypothetical protein
MYISALIHISWFDYPSIDQIGVIVNVIKKLYEFLDVLSELMRWPFSLQVKSNW